MLRGSCCCQAIEFEVDAEPKMIGACHCSRCRKTGSPAFIVIRSEAFRFTKGQEFVARYVPERLPGFSGTHGAGCGRNPSRPRDRSLLSFHLNAEVAEAQRRPDKGRIGLQEDCER